MVDGKTYYYLYNVEDNVVHVCSNGKTLCGLTTEGLTEFNPPTGATIDLSATVHKLCSKCANYKEPKRKKASFETKAEMVDPAKEE